jgi:hypothetical protein
VTLVGAVAVVVGAPRRSDGAERARAAARLVYVREEGADACPTEQAFRDAVSARLGYDPFLAEAPDTVTLSIARENRAFRGKLAVVRADAPRPAARSLESSSCEDLVTTAALSASVALDPLHGTGPPPPPPPQRADPPPPAPAETRPAPEAAPPPPAASRRAEIVAGVVAYGSLGTAPGATVGGGVHADLRLRPLRFGVEGRAELPAEADSPVVGRVRASSLSALALACGELPMQPFVVFACGEGALLWLRASSVDTPVVRESQAVVPAVGARLGALLPVGVVELRAYAEALARLAEVRLEQDGREAYAFSTLVGTFGISAGLRF